MLRAGAARVLTRRNLRCGPGFLALAEGAVERRHHLGAAERPGGVAGDVAVVAALHFLRHRGVGVLEIGRELKAVVVDDRVDTVADAVALCLYRAADGLDVGSAAHLQVLEVAGLNTNYVEFNVKKDPFTSKEVRQALNYAVNKEELSQGLYAGAMVPAGGVLPPHGRSSTA